MNCQPHFARWEKQTVTTSDFRVLLNGSDLRNWNQNLHALSILCLVSDTNCQRKMLLLTVLNYHCYTSVQSRLV